MTAFAAAGRSVGMPSLAVAAGYASFFPLAVASPAAAGGVFWLLALAGLVVWVRRRARMRSFVAPRRAALLAVALVPIGLNLASKLLYGLPWRTLSWTPFLVLPALAVLVRAVALDARALLAGAVLGGFGAAGIALFGWLELGAQRADWTLNAILFGQAALTYAIVALLGWRWRLPFRWPALLPAAVVAALVAFALSGFRGGLLALPLVAIALLVGRRSDSAALRSDPAALHAAARASPAGAPTEAAPQALAPRRRSRWRPVVVIGAVAVAGLLALSRSPVTQRVGEIGDEVSGFSQGHIAHSSVGSRLAMWQAALTLVREHPVFGVGAQRFQPAVAALRAQGRFPPDVDLFRHAHNTYLTVAAEYGAIGVAAWALVLACLWRLLGRAEPPARRIGRCVLACWLAFALTNDILAHQTTLRLVVMVLAGCIGAVARIAPSERPPTEQNPR